MNVHVPETGYQVLASPVDDSRRAGIVEAAGLADLADASLIDDDRHARSRGGARAVDDRRIADDEDVVRWSATQAEPCRQDE
jgi:hypothetical protein